MGFFKKLLKRKKGGTFFGNLLRGVSNKVSGGVLGNGEGLAKWEASQGMNPGRPVESPAFQQGAKLAQPLADQIDRSPQKKKAEKTLITNWLKKKWWIPVSAIVGLVAAIWGLPKLFGKKRKGIKT